LSKVVPFVKAGHGWLGKVLPHGGQIEEIGGCCIDVLERIVSVPYQGPASRDSTTYHAGRDHDGVVGDQPRLLREPNASLSLLHAAPPCERCVYEVEHASAKAGKDHDPAEDIFQVIGAWVVASSLGVVIGEGEELDSRRSQRGKQ